MERKKYFTVYYNNGDGCGVEFSSEYHNYITNNYINIWDFESNALPFHL